MVDDAAFSSSGGATTSAASITMSHQEGDDLPPVGAAQRDDPRAVPGAGSRCCHGPRRASATASSASRSRHGASFPDGRPAPCRRRRRLPAAGSAPGTAGLRLALVAPLRRRGPRSARPSSSSWSRVTAPGAAPVRAPDQVRDVVVQLAPGTATGASPSATASSAPHLRAVAQISKALAYQRSRPAALFPPGRAPGRGRPPSCRTRVVGHAPAGRTPARAGSPAPSRDPAPRPRRRSAGPRSQVKPRWKPSMSRPSLLAEP